MALVVPYCQKELHFKFNKMKVYPTLAPVLLILLHLACSDKSKLVNEELSLEEIALEIIQNAGTCTLITVDSTGQPRARVMDPFPAEEGFVIWFGTNTRSRKVQEINANSKVTVHYYDKESAAYVSLYGTAVIIDDEGEKAKYWQEKWAAFYPNYPEGYSLIHFVPTRLELISEKHGIAGDRETWQPAEIQF